MTGESQARWICLDRSEGSVVLTSVGYAVSLAPATEADRMASWRGSVAAAQARKTEGGASMHALLTSSPPPHVNRHRRLFTLCIRELNVENSLKFVLQHHVEL